MAVLPPLPSLTPAAVPRFVKFPPVSASNWINWKLRTTTVLQIFQVWDHVESDLSATRPDPAIDSRISPAHLAAWDHAERIALTQVLHNIDDSKLTITRKCSTARQAWVALEANFVQASMTARMSILEDITQFAFQPESTVLDHTNRLRALVDTLEESGGSMPQDQLVLHLLNSMPEEYALTAVVLRMQPPASLTLDHVCNALMAAETTFTTKKRKGATSYVTQIQAATVSGGRGSSKPKPSDDSKRAVPCTLCNKSGHLRENCFQDPKVGYPAWWQGKKPMAGDTNKQQKGEATKKAKKRHEPSSPAAADDDDESSDDESSKKKTKKTKGEVSFHTTVDSHDPGTEAAMAFLNTMNTSVTPNGAMLQQSSSSSWVIDSGTTAHFCRDRSLLVDFIATTPATVRMGSATTTSTAKGTAVLWVSTDGVNYDRRVTLKNVLYVPDFTVNLVSVRKLARAGYGLHVMGNNAHLTMADNTPFAVVHGNDRDDLYVLEARTSKSCPANAGSYHTAQSSAGGEQNEAVPVCAVSLNVHSAQILAAPRDVSPLRLMHERLNHLNVRQMVQMRASDMVEGAHSLPSSIPPSGSRLSCESCIIGKSHRATMPRKATAQRVTRCLQLVHSDVCGPVRCPAFNNEERYLVTFVDDFSRYVVVYAMKTRDEVLGHFKVYQAWAEKATGHKITTLRTDGGGEYTSGAFTAYLRQEGIQRQLTPPHTPEHNGVAERLNLIIFGAVRCMLHRARLPASFWAEAAFNAVYVRNRCPTRAVKDRTPYEVWTGHKPSIDHLRVFGCLAYVHVDDAARRTGKLDGRGFPCVFLGYSSESKAWRLYNPASKTTQKRLFVSRDVTFLEDQLVDIDGVLTSSRVGEGESAEDLFPDAGVDASMSGHEDSDGLPALIPPPADLGMPASSHRRLTSTSSTSMSETRPLTTTTTRTRTATASSTRCRCVSCSRPSSKQLAVRSRRCTPFNGYSTDKQRSRCGHCRPHCWMQMNPPAMLTPWLVQTRTCGWLPFRLSTNRSRAPAPMSSPSFPVVVRPSAASGCSRSSAMQTAASIATKQGWWRRVTRRRRVSTTRRRSHRSPSLPAFVRC